MTTKGQFLEKPLPSAAGVDADGNGANPPTRPETPEEASMWHAASPWVHGALGVASFVPGLSVVTGALDASIFAAEGNKIEAALAVASMIPGGKAATTAAKVAKRVAKAAEEVSVAARIVKGTIEAKNVATAAHTATEISSGTKLANERHIAADTVRNKPKASRSSGGGKDEVAVRREVGRKGEKGKHANRADISHRLAEEVNATFPEGWAPPYKPDTRVTEFTSTVDDAFVRVHGDNNMTRSWMMKREAIEGLTALQIQAKYALPELPTFMSEIVVPAGTRIRTGIVNPVFGGIGNATQYELLQRLPTSAFSNTVRLGK